MIIVWGGYMSHQSIINELERNGGFLLVTMKRLREADGVSKLGERVITRIAKNLSYSGLGSIQRLTLVHSDKVMLYKLGGLEEELINAIKKPSSGSEAILAKACSSHYDSAEYKDALKKISDVLDLVM